MKQYDRFVESIQFVLVAYGVDFRNSPAYTSIEQIASSSTTTLHVAVHDNSPTLAGPLPHHEKIDLLYVAQRENIGISRSYNQAADTAAAEGRKWLLFLDQDTRLTANLLSRYQEASCRNPTIKLFCPMLRTQSGKIISPFSWRLSRGTSLFRVRPGIVSCSRLSVCNSAMFTDVETFQQVGGYNPGIFLDYSDASFFRRYARAHDSFFVVNEIVEHNLSSMEELDPDKALFRFGKYCESAQAYGKEFSTGSILRAYAFVRAMKLAARWKDRRFLSVYLSAYGKGL